MNGPWRLWLKYFIFPDISYTALPSSIFVPSGSFKPYIGMKIWGVWSFGTFPSFPFLVESNRMRTEQV